MRAEEKGEGRGRRRRKIAPRWMQPAAERPESSGRGAPPGARRGPDPAPGGTGKAPGSGDPRTGQAEPGRGGRGERLGRSCPRLLPRVLLASSIPSSKFFFPAKRPTRNAFPSFTETLILSSSPLRRALSRSHASLELAKSPAAKRRRISSSFYIYRKEIVLLKAVQEQFGNIINSWEVQPIFPTQSKSRLKDKKGNKNGLWRNSLTVCLTHIHW